MKTDYSEQAKIIYQAIKFNNDKRFIELIKNELEIAHANGMIEALKDAKEMIWEK